MATLILAFANGDKQEYLPTIRNEYESVMDALREGTIIKQGTDKSDYIVVADPNSTIDKINKDLRWHESDVCVFLFSGHAGKDKLLFEDGLGNSNGIAETLGRCSKHKLVLVILNGCSTEGQVKKLLDNGVPIVIATSAPIGDQIASTFSIVFFEELALRRKSIQDSFNQAISASKFKGLNESIYFSSRGLGTKNSNKSLWGLFYNENNKDLLTDWNLYSKELHVSNSELKSWISSNKINEVLNVLRESPQSQKEAIQLENRFSKLKRDQRLGIISFENASMVHAQIVDAVFTLVDEL